MVADEERQRARRRLRGFGLHLAGYFAALAVLVAVNFLVSPDSPWFIWPMVGWAMFHLTYPLAKRRLVSNKEIRHVVHPFRRSFP